MRPQRLHRWATMVLLSFVWSSHAGPSTSVAVEAKDDARVWLQRIGKAASTSSYVGTKVFSVGGSSSTSRVARYCVGPQSYEHTESMDGPARSIYRHNHVVHTIWPSKKVAVVEQRDALMPLPALAAGGVDVTGTYSVALEGSDRVAAQRTRILLLTPRDGHRFAQRLWAHEDSGLMLRADVLSPEGQVLESSAFTDIKVGVKPQPDSVLAGMHKLDGYRVVRTAITRTQLQSEGWRLDVPVPGFQQISCVKRPVEGGEANGGAPAMVQSIYSDGLVHISVFIEPYQAQRHQPMMSSWGATHALAQQRDQHWVTVMGDVPFDTIKKFVAALEKL